MNMAEFYNYSSLLLIIDFLAAFLLSPVELQYSNWNFYQGPEIPHTLRGEWFSREKGQNVITSIDTHDITDRGPLMDMTSNNNDNFTLVLYNSRNNCHYCVRLIIRTLNVIEKIETQCITPASGQDFRPPSLGSLCRTLDSNQDYITMFSTNPSGKNCRSSLEGRWRFAYTIQNRFSGECSNSESKITACQKPGTQFFNVNQQFLVEYRACPGMQDTQDALVEYKCLGDWYVGKNHYFAVKNTRETRIEEAYRCFLTNRDDDSYLSVSNTAECNVLRSPQQGPERWRVSPIKDDTVTPKCTLPQNMTGVWIDTANFDAEVTIDSTKMVERWQPDTGRVKQETYACLENRGSRYVMARLGVNGCQKDYVCFNFVRRHHNILRYRRGQAVITDNFATVCSWSMFENQENWMYDLMVAKNPVPIKCPVAVSDVSICDDQKTISLDPNYCISVDHNGRPVDIYSEPDYEMQCIGFWKENLRSYFITYDPVDAYSRYRCWVYQRSDQNRISMSMSVGAFCHITQTVESYNAREGAQVALSLTEYEREADDCPMYFDDGSDPYNADTDAALHDFLILLLKEYVENWFQVQSEHDKEFIDELHQTLYRALALIIKRFYSVDFVETLVESIFPMLICHLDTYLTAKQKAKSSADLEETFKREFVERHGEIISRDCETSWLRIVVQRLLPHLIPKEYITSKVSSVFIRELLACGILSPLLDIVSEPQFLYTLLDYLLFHGDHLGSISLPPKRTFGKKSQDYMRTRQNLFERFLQCLLAIPTLRKSELVHAFLCSSTDTKFNSGILSDIRLGKMIKTVPAKLSYERGQHLESFLTSFIASTESNSCLDQVINKNFGANCFETRAKDLHYILKQSLCENDNYDGLEKEGLTGSSHHSIELESSQTADTQNGTQIPTFECQSLYDCILYLLLRVYRIDNIFIDILISLRTIGRFIVQYACKAFLRYKIAQGVRVYSQDFSSVDDSSCEKGPDKSHWPKVVTKSVTVALLDALKNSIVALKLQSDRVVDASKERTCNEYKRFPPMINGSESVITNEKFQSEDSEDSGSVSSSGTLSENPTPSLNSANMEETALGSLTKILPRWILSILGPEAHKKACYTFLSSLKYHVINRQVVISLLDKKLGQLFPEIKQSPVFN
ncbi:Sorting nexin-14 [Fragariocoptes setiger]|uniref:Sorting nexin-14 n=1 Tax=Fragariocoptes setiger TaxID=1670756 RepID=A0ABQ7SA03_9ACAR|nr:Sorting nexin-14 [Fragariocoptes setiger]